MNIPQISELNSTNYENSLIYQHCSNLNHEMKLEDAKILI